MKNRSKKEMSDRTDRIEGDRIILYTKEVTLSHCWVKGVKNTINIIHKYTTILSSDIQKSSR